LRKHMLMAPRAPVWVEEHRASGDWRDLLPNGFFHLYDTLALCIATAGAAHQQLTDLQIKHRPVNLQAKLVARVAARAYERLTGEAPTLSIREIETAPGEVKARRCGRFVEFLKHLFAALQIDASAEYEAEALLKHKRRRQRTP